MPGRVAAIEASRRLRLLGRHDMDTDVDFSDRISCDRGDSFHVNNGRFAAFDADGDDMQHQHKEPARGGLALNVVER